METKFSQVKKDAALNSLYGNLEVIGKWSRSTFIDNASWIKTYMKPNVDILSEVLPESELLKQNEELRKVKDELLVMLQKIYNINNVAFSLKNFDVNRLKKEIGAAIDNANKL